MTVHNIEKNFRETLIEDMSDMVFVMKVGSNDTFIYEYLNPAAEATIDYETSIIGKTLQEVNSNEVMPRLYEKYKYVVDNQTKITFQDSYLSKQGEMNYTETRLTPLLTEDNECTHIMTMVKDITKEVTITKRLEVSEENLYIISNYTGDIITLVDPSGKVIYTSPTYEKMLGFNQDHCLDVDFINTVYLPDREKVKVALDIGLKDKKKFLIQFQQYTKNNQLIWCESRGAPVLNDEDDLIHIVITTRNISDQKKYEEELERLALHDPLTGLANRRLFKNHMAYALKILKELDDGIAVIMLDIDNFKQINDQYGHDTGDDVLKEFCKRLSESIGVKDTVARLGGDEFVVLLPHAHKIGNAVKIAERIKQSVNTPWEVKGESLEITTSMGIALTFSSKTNSRTLLREADQALYKAKESGKNHYKISDGYKKIPPLDIEKPI